MKPTINRFWNRRVKAHRQSRPAVVRAPRLLDESAFEPLSAPMHSGEKALCLRFSR
jgi:hypothetical protein